MKVYPLSLRSVRLIVLSGLICLSMQVEAQKLVGGSLFARSSENNSEFSDSRVWLRFANHFTFKEGMSIDSELGHQFFTDGSKKRLGIRSMFLYDMTENLTLGGGMGFFWTYGEPPLSQELRLAQQISYHKPVGSSIMNHRLMLEEQIVQNIGTADSYNTRLRYQFGMEFPTNSNIYFGVSDEIFTNLSDNAESELSRLNKNRLAAYIGYDTFDFFKIEAQIMMEDRFSKLAGLQTRSWVFSLTVRQTI